MKKMFLSLATIAFVATGALTVTSCGSDDSFTVIPDIEESAGVLKYNGDNYDLDNVTSWIYAYKDGEGKNIAEVYDVLVNEGEDNEKTIRATKWDIIAYSGEDPITAEVYHQLNIYVPIDENNTVLAPHAAENLYLAEDTFIYAGGDEPVDLGRINSYDFKFNAFDDEEQKIINYSTSLIGAIGTVTTDYDGDLIGTEFYIPKEPKGKGVSSLRRALGGEKVNLRDVELSKEAVLVKLK